MKNITNDYINDVIELYNNFIKDIDDVLELCENTPSKIKKKVKNNSVEVDNKNESTNDLCNLVNVSEEWISWSTELSEKSISIPIKFSEFLASITGESVEYIKNLFEQGIDQLINWINKKIEELATKSPKLKKILKKAIAKVKIAIAKIKIAILNGQIFVYKSTKKVLESIRVERVNSALNNILPGILESLQLCSTSIITALAVINEIIKTLGMTMMSIDAGTMSFFMTPKILMTGLLHYNMKPMAQDLSSSGIMKIVDEAVDTYVNGIKDANAAIKYSFIMSNIALSETSGELPDIDELNLKLIDTNNLKNIARNAIMTALATMGEPLPKYENLKITNLGFQMWLNTVFESAMKTCFGLPGFP